VIEGEVREGSIYKTNILSQITINNIVVVIGNDVSELYFLFGTIIGNHKMFDFRFLLASNA